MSTTHSNAVLFVCLGNICRSPMAEAVFKQKVKEAGLSDQYVIDSAGTAGYHVGERADERSILVGAKHGLDVESLARKLRSTDFSEYQIIVAMDDQNLKDIKEIMPSDFDGELLKMTQFHPTLNHIHDPYYDGLDAFETMYHTISSCCDQLLTYLSNPSE